MTFRVVKFETKYESGKAVDMVLIAPLGEAFERTKTWHQVSKLVPPKDPSREVREADTFVAMSARWEIIGPAYDAWKAGMEIPEGGTPLAAWAGVTAEQAEVLRALGIRSVEDVRDMTDGTISRLPFPNGRQMPKLARDFLDGADAAKKDAENSELKERIAAMEEMLAEAMAAKPAKRGPGRPRKEEAKDEEAA